MRLENLAGRGVVESLLEAQKSYPEFNLKTAVDARFIAQHLDLSSYMKIVLITKKVTTQIFITLSKSICYTLNSHATAVLRFIDTFAAFCQRNKLVIEAAVDKKHQKSPAVSVRPQRARDSIAAGARHSQFPPAPLPPHSDDEEDANVSDENWPTSDEEERDDDDQAAGAASPSFTSK